MTFLCGKKIMFKIEPPKEVFNEFNAEAHLQQSQHIEKRIHNATTRIEENLVSIFTSNQICTVWKLNNFSVTQILRKIKIGKF